MTVSASVKKNQKYFSIGTEKVFAKIEKME